MAKKEKKRKWLDFEDDGRTVADMDIDGMPWSGSMIPGINMRKGASERMTHEREKQLAQSVADLHITKEERRAMIAAAFKILIPWAIIFFAVSYLVVLFLVKVWLRV